MDTTSEYIEDNIIDAMIEFGELVRGHAEMEHRKFNRAITLLHIPTI